MRRQIFFISLLLLLLLSFAFFLWQGGGEIVAYVKLSQQKEILLTRWWIEEKKGQFFLIGEASADSLATASLVLKGGLPNRYVAEAESKKFLPGQSLLVWYNPNNVKEMSINRDFPKKRLVYLLLFVGVGLYFIFLKQRVGDF